MRSPDTNIFEDITNNELAQVSWVMPSGRQLRSSRSAVGQSAAPIGCLDRQRDRRKPVLEQHGDHRHVGRLGRLVRPRASSAISRPANRKLAKGLGFRVPLIVISPYAKAGYISHQEHEIASTLRLIEETFGLAVDRRGLGQRRMRTGAADGFDDMFDFTQQPLHYKKIAVKYDARYFLTHPDNTPADSY